MHWKIACICKKSQSIGPILNRELSDKFIIGYYHSKVLIKNLII
jgi:hypothetical protein